MITEGTEVLVGPLSIVKEIGIGMVPDNFKRAINYGWTAVVGMGNWVAYVLAMIYYVSKELGIGNDICEGFGYGYWLVDQLQVLVDFMPKGDSSSGGGLSSMLDISKLASGAAKNDAAAAALAAALGTKAAAEDAAATALQAEIDAGTTTGASAEASADTSTAAKE